MAKIYVASSWRNKLHPGIVVYLREKGHEVYDFRNPPHGRGGFAWSEIDPNWQKWTANEYREALASPIAMEGFLADFHGMKWAEVCVLVLPCGRSAHLEAGWMAGHGKYTIVWTHDGEEPELMALLCNQIVTSSSELQQALQNFDNNKRLDLNPPHVVAQLHE